jgi:hypothetical protein
MDKSVKKGPKTPYSPPVLTIYGTVQKLTQKLGIRGQPDGGSRGSIRTHV